MTTKSANVTRYEGRAPAAVFDIDRVRASVPDDPIRLPSGHLACEGCGIATTGPVVDSLPLDLGGKIVAQYTRCEDCQQLDDHAGGDRRVRVALYALAVIGQPAPRDPLPLVPWMRVDTSWADPQAPSRDLCNPHPWAHVSMSQRAQIREAYLLAMRSRIRMGAPSIPLPPPWGGACLFCGVGSLSLPPIDVVRRGGRERAAHSIWRRIRPQPTALGGRGPDLMDGFVCPPCSEALDATGAVGVRARARAFEQHVRENRSEAEANRVRSILDSYEAIVLPGWAALDISAPNPEPWSHIAVPEPDPVPEIAP